MRKNITRSITSEYEDKEGNYRRRTERIEVVRNEVEPFFLTYSKQIMALYGKPIFNATTKVFWKLLEFAEFNTGKVFMNVNRRKEIMEICKISRASFDRAITELIEANIMTKDKDTYTINEDMFWKGDSKSREEIKKARFKMIFTPVFLEK